jgi:hypothetical protein
MNAPRNTTQGRNVGIAAGALFASSTTLVCCVLPAVLVSLGAGAALAGLVSTVPQIVWLSEHKTAVFGAAAIALLIAGFMLWRARTLPCPADPQAARSCRRLRRVSVILYAVAAGAYLLGVLFAFALPAIMGTTA